MKKINVSVLNISAKELLKNKLYFSYFTLGLAVLLSVVCVLANYSRQVFDGFFTQFNNGSVLPLEMKELPRDCRYYDDFLIYARASGVTYNIDVSYGEKSVFLPSYRGGVCLISEGDGAPLKKFMPMMFWFGIKPNFDKETIFLGERLAEELGCERGDTITIGGTEYKINHIIPPADDAYSFVIYDPEITANEFTVVLSNKEQLLDISDHLNSDNFNDKDGLIALCSGYRGMKAGINIVLILLVAICAAYIFVFVKMYFEKRGELVKILFGLGIQKIQLFGCLGAVFIPLCFIGSAVGFLMCVLLDKLVDKWAQELINMTVDKVNYAAYFVVCFAACAVISAIALIINLLKKSRISGGRNE